MRRHQFSDVDRYVIITKLLPSIFSLLPVPIGRTHTELILFRNVAYVRLRTVDGKECGYLQKA
jgi:hypothetical protein